MSQFFGHGTLGVRFIDDGISGTDMMASGPGSVPGDLGADLTRLAERSLQYPLPEPSPGGWALSEAACQFVGTFVAWYRPHRVLELGSGFSSLVVSLELARHPHGKLDSIDNSMHWSELARRMAHERAALDRVEFHRFPLGVRVRNGVPCVFYKIPGAFWEGRAPYDLAIVDGPHHDVGRDGALPEILPWLRTGGYVILDDCRSEHMRETVAKWRVRFGSSVVFADPLALGNGVGVVRKLGVPHQEPPALSLGQLAWEWLRTLRNAIRIRRLRLNHD